MFGRMFQDAFCREDYMCILVEPTLNMFLLRTQINWFLKEVDLKNGSETPTSYPQDPCDWYIYLHEWLIF